MAFPMRTSAIRNWFAADEGRRLWMYPITVEEVDQPAVLAMAHYVDMNMKHRTNV